LNPRQARKTSVSLKDALLSALAVFSFKWPSLLSFEIDMQHDEVNAGNLRQLFHIDRVSSDTTMREIIDEIPPEALHEVFTRVFAALQRGKDLEAYAFIVQWSPHRAIETARFSLHSRMQARRSHTSI